MSSARVMRKDQDDPDQDKSASDTDGNSKDGDEPFRTPWTPILIVLAVELCERLTYYTFAASQKTYMNKNLGFSPSSAASMNSVFSMLCYMWCLPGGVLADVIGRYKVIVMLSSLYAVGTLLCAISVHADVQLRLKGLFLFGALGLIPIGTGGIKPNICNFGADQIGDETEAQRTAQKSYFSFFYLSINIGVLFAFGFLINITTHGLPDLGVDIHEGYFFAYLVAAGSMLLAVTTFVVSTRYFTILPGGGIDGFTVMVETVAYSVRSGGGWRAWACAAGWVLMPLFFVTTLASALQPGPPPSDSVGEAYPNRFEETCAQHPDATTAGSGVLPAGQARRLRDLGNGTAWATGATFLEADFTVSELVGVMSLESAAATALEQTAEHSAAPRRLSSGGGGGGAAGELLTQIALYMGSVSCVCLTVAHLNNGWLKPLPAKMLGDREFTIQEVRAGFATVPFIIVVNLAFSISYNAMNNAFPSQACQMNTMINGSQLNGAFFNIGDALAITVLTPIFENCVYPMVGKFKGTPVRLGQKLIAGLLVAACANLAAAYIEVQRRKAPLMCGMAFSECAPNGIHMRDISAFRMFVPFALIGMAEILVNPCMYYFAYKASPPKVRSLIQAFNLFFQGSVSNAFTAVAMKATFPNDLDTGNLEYYYFVNVVCAFIGVVLYFYITRCGNNAEDVAEEIRDEELDPTEHSYAEREEHEELESADSDGR